MLCVDSPRLCMSGLSLCDVYLCCSMFGSQFSNKYLLTYLLKIWQQTLDSNSKQAFIYPLWPQCWPDPDNLRSGL